MDQPAVGGQVSALGKRRGDCEGGNVGEGVRGQVEEERGQGKIAAAGGGGPADSRPRGIVAALSDYRAAVLTGWYLVIIVLIAHRFWDYWITLV